MKRRKLELFSADELLSEFVRIAAAQVSAELNGDTRKMSQLFWEMEAVEAALKARPGDQRRVLTSLFEHSSAQVRMKAALATLALDPKRARAVLENISAAGPQPQGLEAGMALYNIDIGVFTPS